MREALRAGCRLTGISVNSKSADPTAWVGSSILPGGFKVVTVADKMERSATRPRKVLIVITDGDDNASKLTLGDAIHRVQDMQADVWWWRISACQA